MTNGKEYETDRLQWNHRYLIGLVLTMFMPLCGCGESSLFKPGIPQGIVDGKKLKEISGMVASRQMPGLLWAHNDGSQGGLFALSTNGTLLATFRLETEVTDLEDISLGPGPVEQISYLYLGDIGDNNQERRFIKIYRFPEPPLDPAVRAKQVVRIRDFETIILTYPNKPHDAEALLVDPQSGDLFIVTKEKKRARVYSAKKAMLRPGRTTPLTLLGELASAQVSAGDISPDGSEILLRRENAAWLWRRSPHETVADSFSRSPLMVAVIGPPAEPNGEAITFCADGSGYYTLSEGSSQPIFFFPRTAR